MKDKQLSSILALSLALGLLAPFELLVQTAPEEWFFDPVRKVKTEAELFAAVHDPRIEQIILANDIVLVANLEINRDLTLDLHGFNLTTLKPKLSVIDIKTGHVTITGKGSIVAYGTDSTAVRIKGAVTAENSNYAYVMIDKKVKLFAPNYYGILVIPNFHSAYGVSVDFHGSIVARDGICIHRDIVGKGVNAPRIMITGSANLTVDETFGTAICAFGYGQWEISAAEIAGARGIAARAGRLNLAGAKIMATGAFGQDSASPLFSNLETQTSNASNTQSITPNLENLGSVIQIEDQPNSAANIKIDIKDGEYISAQSYVFSETGYGDTNINALELLNIESGTFAGQMGIFYGLAPHSAENAATVIYGGAFNSDVSNYLASGHHLEKNRKRGIYTVINENPIEELDDAALLARAEGKLHALLELAEDYLTGNFAAGNLGDWQTRVTRALASLKRAVTISKKSLRGATETEKLTAAVRMLERAIENLRSIADDLRAELANIVASVKSIDPADYTNYSYRQVVAAVDESMPALRGDVTTLEALYSSLVEIEINIDLLESRSSEDADLEDLAPAALPEIPEPLLSAMPQTLLSSAELPPTPVVPVEKPVENSQTDTQAATPANFAHPQTIELDDDATNLAVAGLLQLIASDRFDEVVAEEIPLDEPSTTNSAAVAYDPETLAAATNLRNLLNAISTLNPSDYTASSFAVLAETMNYAGELLSGRYELEINSLTNAFNNINIAYSSLIKKVSAPTLGATEGAKANLSVMIDAVQNLTVNDYEPDQAEQFGELQVALARGQALLARQTFAITELVEIMDAINSATSGLKVTPDAELESAESADDSLTIAVQVDWSALQNLVANISTLIPDNYTTTSYAKLLAELERAKTMVSDPNTTQTAADEIVSDLSFALQNLELAPSYTQPVRADEIINPTVAPNLLMSMMAGAYAGLATYRKSRLAAKKRKQFSM